MTFANMRKQNRQQQQEEEPELKDTGERNTFTDDDLILHWTMMCNRMPQQMAGLAARMKNLTPHITEMPNIEVVVDNELLLNQMREIEKRISITLARDLHNTSINLSLRLAEANEVTRILTKRELFDKMREKNPAIERLSNMFNLEMA